MPPASQRARSCSEGDEGGSGGDSEADGGDGVDDYLCAKMHLVSLFVIASLFSAPTSHDLCTCTD